MFAQHKLETLYNSNLESFKILATEFTITLYFENLPWTVQTAAGSSPCSLKHEALPKCTWQTQTSMPWTGTRFPKSHSWTTESNSCHTQSWSKVRPHQCHTQGTCQWNTAQCLRTFRPHLLEVKKRNRNRDRRILAHMLLEVTLLPLSLPEPASPTAHLKCTLFSFSLKVPQRKQCV